MKSDGPYVLGDELKTDVSRRTLESDAHVKIANLAYADGRKSMEKDFNELLDNTGFLATILHQIAYKWIHGDDDIPGEGCDCPKEFARESLRLSCEEFFSWKKSRGLE